MKRRELLEMIAALEKRVADLEARPLAYWYPGVTPQPDLGTYKWTCGNGTADPMPEPVRTYCEATA